MESGKLKEADTHKEMYFRVAALTCNAQMHKKKFCISLSSALFTCTLSIFSPNPNTKTACLVTSSHNLQPA